MSYRAPPVRIETRPITTGDGPLLRQVMLDAAVAHAAAPSITMFRDRSDAEWDEESDRMANIPTMAKIVAITEGRGVGVVWCSTAGDTTIAHLTWGYVSSDSTTEVGRSLLACAADWATKRGRTILTAATGVGRVAEHLVETYGFEVVGQRDGRQHLIARCDGILDS